MRVSAFSFIHNGFAGGYPFIEAIEAVRPYVDSIYMVDMQSDDGTREYLETMEGINIINGFWGAEAGKTLREAHAQYLLCDGDIIWHFEADEVYDEKLAKNISHALRMGHNNLKVQRLQIEQNFQRVRWYPELVHRIFPKHAQVSKDGHTTDKQQLAIALSPDHGFLWDCTNCFRDNWFNRVNQQAELRDVNPQYLMVGLHALHKTEWTEKEIALKLLEPHWDWRSTPLAIPEILKPLVGQTKYGA